MSALSHPAAAPPTARGLPGWALRLVLGLAGGAAVVVAMAGAGHVDAVSVAGFVMLLLVLGAAAAPASVVPLLLLIGVVLYRLLAGDPTFGPALAGLVFLTALVHQLAGLAAAIPARSRCRWSALLPAALRFVMVVVPVEAAVLIAAASGAA